MKKYLFGLLILNFPLHAADSEQMQHKDSQSYYSLGVSYLDPVTLNASFATTGGYMLLGYKFSPALLDSSDFSIAAEGKLSFGIKGEQHINEYSGDYVVRDGKLAYATSLAFKLNYAINNTLTVFATSGVDHFTWRYQLKDQNSVLNNMDFEGSHTAMAWGLGLDYQFSDIAITTEINALGFNLGLRKMF